MNKRLSVIFAAALALLIPLCALNVPADVARADTGDYTFGVGSYNVLYDIGDNCEISVTETITITYLGRDSTGFMRDIPVNDGARVKNVKVEGVSLISGGTDVPYEVRIDYPEFITVDIGDRSLKKGKSETYRLTYLYCVENNLVEGGFLPLTPIGTGWECALNDVNVKMIMPEGLQSVKMYVGYSGSGETRDDYDLEFSGGRPVITAYFAHLPAREGVTFDLNFTKGAISPYFDFTPYFLVIAAAALLAVIILAKLCFFNKPLTPVVNFEAPNGMDPLIMGKLIDNKVNSEDVTSLIFYWADRGFLKINLDDENDPVLIKIKNLPDDSPDYQKTVFNGLFNNRDMVKTNSLTNVFYRTYERATVMVNQTAKGLFTKASAVLSAVFAILAALLAGVAPWIMGAACISGTMTYFEGLFAIIPAVLVYAFAQSAFYNRLKNRGTRNALFFALILGAAAALALFSAVLVPSALMSFPAKAALYALCFSGVAAAATLINRTADYTRKLNEIIGFRNFILTAEKDRLELLLEGDPQFYYHVLPYAQVLNVSDKWEEKFENLTVEPPQWAVSSSFERTMDFVIINHMIRSSATGLAMGMVSKPSSSGSNGSGGGFGGHSGGGFGGGGGRGR